MTATEETRFLARGSEVFLRRILALFTIFTIGFFLYQSASNNFSLPRITFLLAIVPIALSWLRLRRGRVREAFNILSWGIWLAATVLGFLVAGIRTPALILYPALIMATGWLQGRRQAYWMLAASIAVLLVLVFGAEAGLFSATIQRTPREVLFTFLPTVILVAMLSVSLAEYEQRSFAVELELKRALEAKVVELQRSEDAVRALNRGLEHRVLQRTAELNMTAADLNQAQQQLLQAEKQTMIGQLAAGVAHEINNPIAFVQSNLNSLQRYFEQLTELLEAYREGQTRLCSRPGGCEGGRAWLARTRQLSKKWELGSMANDIPLLLQESREGIARIRRIVADLRDFSRVDGNQQWEWANLRSGLDSTLNIISSELRYRADVVKECGELPAIKCLPAQLNQVFLNLLLNAAQAIPENRRGTISIRCGTNPDGVWVEIADTGTGILPENLNRIFDPFFTTRPAGKGTGLGLSLSQGIVQKHGGRIEVKTEVGIGSSFRVSLPIDPHATADDASAVSPAPTS